MKKLLLLMLLVPMLGAAQWEYETVDNGFDKAYKIAYTKKVYGAYLKLENVDGDIFLYLQQTYDIFCEEETLVELSFYVNGKYEKYSTSDCVISDDLTTVFIMPDISTSTCVDDFKNSTKLKIRITQETCGQEVYEYNMTGSTKALTFMK
jgi:hypothetical protein